jgi:hypothetical protein
MPSRRGGRPAIGNFTLAWCLRDSLRIRDTVAAEIIGRRRCKSPTGERLRSSYEFFEYVMVKDDQTRRSVAARRRILTLIMPPYTAVHGTVTGVPAHRPVSLARPARYMCNTQNRV